MLLYACNSKEPIHISNIYQGRTLVDIVEAVPKRKLLVDIGVYCLMPSHHHLLLRERSYGGITSFMRKLGTGYTMYFNKKYERTGALFQGKFKAKLMTTDQYLTRATNYIHANPAELIAPKWRNGIIGDEKKVRKFLSEYRYSSLPDYLDSRPNNPLLDKDALLASIESPPSLKSLIDEARIYARQEESDFY